MNFFSAEPSVLVLSEFDIMHIAAILFFAASIILAVIFRKRLRNSNHERTFRYVITILAIAFEVGFKIWHVLTQEGTFLNEYLPLDLCAISLYLSWALCFTKKEWIYKLVYFYSMGAVISMFVPELGGFGINHFRYYHYFYVHGYIIFTAIYFAAVHQYRITFKDLIKSTGILIVIAAFAMLIDFLVGANYMYLMHKPHAGSPLDMFGPWPEYVYALVIITMCVFIVIYLPWIFINRRHKTLAAQSRDLNISG